MNLQVNLSFSICTTPPTKLDFINALGFVMPLQEEEEMPDFSGAPREWFQMVADKMAQGCPHQGCNKRTVPVLGLVQDCYRMMPPADLSTVNSNMKQPLYFQDDVY